MPQRCVKVFKPHIIKLFLLLFYAISDYCNIGMIGKIQLIKRKFS